MTHTFTLSAFVRTIFPILETIMTPLTSIGRATIRVILAGLCLCLAGFLSPASAFEFTKTGEQIDCDHIRYTFSYKEPNLFETSEDTPDHYELVFTDVLPEGLSWVHAGVSSHNLTGKNNGSSPAISIAAPNKLSIRNFRPPFPADLNGVHFQITAVAKIDRSKLSHGDKVANTATLKILKDGAPVFSFESLPVGMPDDGDPSTGAPFELVLDLENCEDKTPPGGDPIGDDVCFKVEDGVVGCDPKHPGVFIYKMHVGAEFSGKIIELVPTTPGVSIFPPSQVVPLGGGELVWHIHGAVPGMVLHLIANGLADGEIKHVAGPSEGLGLCCTQEIEIIIPVDLDCPTDCKDDDCPPPPPPPPPPPCNPEWEDCPCDPQKEDCDDGKPKLKLDKKVIDEWCLPNGNGTALCTYQIRIQNVGNAVFNGPVTVRDHYPNGAPVSSTFSPAPPWVCGPDGAADKFVCTSNINLPPLAETFLSVQAIVSVDKYTSREVTNCAWLQQLSNQPESCAMAKLRDPRNNPDDVSVEKTGPSRCEPGLPCVFDVTVTNNGDAPFNGQLAIVDGITAQGGDLVNGAQVVSIQPPFGCAVPPASLPIGCVADVSLGAHESRTHKVTVILPDMGVGSASVDQMLRNCVLIGETGVLDAKLDETIEGAGAQANEGSPRYACHNFELVLPQKDQCTSGMVLSIKGRCVCPSGTRWNGRRCFGKPPVIPPVDTFVPPVSIDPVCPRGMDRFRSFKGRPLGYALRTIRSNGRKIICGEPRCERGWSVYKNVGAIPKGWKKKPVGRRGSRYKFWCAKPPRVNPLQCWSSVWTQIQPRQIKSYRQKGYTVKPRVKNSKTIWCVKPGFTPETRPDQCLSGWTKFRKNKVPTGWVSLKRYYDNGRNVCARKNSRPPVVQCWSGWTKVWLGEIKSYQRKGYLVKSRGKGKAAIWCVKPGKPQSCVPGLNEIKRKGRCICKRGYKRGYKQMCVKKATPPVLQCRSSWTPITRGQAKSYKRKGYRIETRGKGKRRIWCARPRQKSCAKLGKIGKWPNCRKKVVQSCARVGKIGKWPNCRKKVVQSCARQGKIGKWPNCRKKVVQSCARQGKIGKWPNCRKKVVQSCARQGKIGKWPNCRKKVVQSCARVGKIGKWPNCRKKPVITFKPKRKTCAQRGMVGKWPRCFKRVQKNKKLNFNPKLFKPQRKVK